MGLCSSVQGSKTSLSIITQPSYSGEKKLLYLPSPTVSPLQRDKDFILPLSSPATSPTSASFKFSNPKLHNRKRSRSIDFQQIPSKSIHEYIKKNKDSIKTFSQTVVGLKIPAVVTSVLNKELRANIALSAYQVPMLRKTDYAFFSIVAHLDRPLNQVRLNELHNCCYLHILDEEMQVHVYQDSECLVSM